MAKQYYEFDTDTEKVTRNVTEEVLKKEEPKKKLDIFKGIDKWKVFKQVVGAVASGCASIVVSKYLKANIPESSSAFEKGVMGVGTYFITGVVGSAVAKYAEQELDDWRDSIMIAKAAEDVEAEQEKEDGNGRD